jgi:hypothetical protein
MKKPDPFIGFIILYFILIIFQLCIHPMPGSGLNHLTTSFLSAISTASLTHMEGTKIFVELSYLQLSITFLSSLILFSYLLWYYWQLFGSREEKENRLGDAFKLSFVISFIFISAQFLFFFYALTGHTSNPSLHEKFISALSLAVYSFANAGLPNFTELVSPVRIEQSFILQIGVVIGNTLGHMGIFVLYELLTPKKLRERLADPSIDWSFITKITVFGTAFLFVIGSCAFYILESGHLLKEKNIIESVIASIYEISTARGFGSSLSENDLNLGSKLLHWFVSLIGSGPFSTGGGLTLLTIIWIYSLIWKNHKNPINIRIASSIVKTLFIYSIITFCLLFIIRLFINGDTPFHGLFVEQTKLFTTHHLMINEAYGWGESLVIGLTLIAGRIGFILACYLTLKKQNS